MTISNWKQRPAFFGAWVVRAAFVLAAFGWGVGFYGPPIYLHAVMERTGWPLTLVSAAVTVHFLSGVLLAANLPRLYARVGVQATIVAGAVVTTIGVCGWAFASRPSDLFLAALVSGMGWVTMGAVAVNAVISPWHVQTRPTALSKAYNGVSIGGLLFSPLWVALIAGFGFAGAAGIIGAVMILVMLLIGRYVFARTPEQMGQCPDGAIASSPPIQAGGAQRVSLPGASLWQDRIFLTLAAGMAIGLFAQMGLLAHLFSLLVPALGTQAAGVVMGGATGCAILGRAVATRLLARVGDRRVVAAWGYGIQASGSLVLLSAQSEPIGLTLLGVALFGSGIGNAISLPPLIAQTDFSSKDAPRVVALIIAIAQAAYAFAPVLFGVLLVASGTAANPGIGARSTWFFAVAACMQLAAAGTLLAGRPRH